MDFLLDKVTATAPRKAALKATVAHRPLDELEAFPEFITPEQLAEQVDVCVDTIYRWVREGCGGPPYARIGRRILFLKEDVRAWVSARRYQHKAEELAKNAA
jgi:excisionase family DNA binding protein